MGTACPACGASAGGVVLTVLTGDAGPASAPAEVPIVRELKLPTLDHLDLDAVGWGDDLPRSVQAAEAALEEGDLAAADELLDRALGCVIAGPGHERRAPRYNLVAVALWVWCAVLLLVFLLGQLQLGWWESTS